MQPTNMKVILLEQQEEVLGLLRSVQSIAREKESEYLEIVAAKWIKVISGVRRCGKSFLSVSAFTEQQNWIYINFDDERLSELTTKELNSIYEAALSIKSDIRYWIFDEIQNIKHWDLFINRLQRKGLNIIVTGSNGKLLSKEISTHLTGRSIGLELFPFSFREFLGSNNIQVNDILTTEKTVVVKNKFDVWFKDGGFPEAIVSPFKKTYLQDLFNKIISRDILQRYNLRNPKGIKQLATIMIESVGQELSYRKLASSLKLGSMNTIKKYIDYLCDCYLFFEVEAYSDKSRERQARPRKIYCIDNGVINAVTVSRSENKGRQLENIVFLELRRRQISIYYLKESDFEVDFIVFEKNKIRKLIQVCWSLSDEKTRQREVQGLVKACHKYNLNTGIILTYDDEVEFIEDGITIECIPVYKWLLSNKI